MNIMLLHTKAFGKCDFCLLASVMSKYTLAAFQSNWMCVTLNNTLISHWIKILRASHAFLPIEIVLMLMNVWILANILYDE